MKQGIVSLLAILILSLPALAQEGRGKAAAVNVQVTATVTAVDQATRMVTLKTPEGKEITTQVGPEVKNLKQVKVGDILNVTYTAAVAVRINPAIAAPSEAKSTLTTAKPGEKPAAVAGNMVTVNAKVEAIDMKGNTVTFKGPKGKTRTVAVQDPEYQAKLKNLKVGDVVEITYAEALAITVEPGKKK